MTTAKLYRDIYVPLPSKPLYLSEQDSYTNVCDKLDDFFDDIVRGYPDDTRELLTDMYYNNTNIDFNGHTLEGGSFANWHIGGTYNDLRYSMSVDSRCYNSGVFFRWNKIHEIAVHIGQAHQRVQQVGVDAFLEEVDSGDFNRLTELSVAPTEKMLLNALPIGVIERELNVYNECAGDILRDDILIRKDMAYDSYMRLQHRVLSCDLTASITEEDVSRLHSRPDMQAFNQKPWHEKASKGQYLLAKFKAVCAKPMEPMVKALTHVKRYKS